MPIFAVSNRLPASALELLRAEGELRLADATGPLPRGELLELVGGADAALTMLFDRVDDEFLAAAGPGLRSVANVAVGFDNIDLSAAARHNVAVTNTPGVLDDATADLTLALVLAATRRLGIVGLGAIGRRVAQRARAFGMSIAYHGRNAAPAEVVAELGAERLDLDELLASSDVVSLHCPLTEETRHLVAARELGLMKPSATLVNTARGPVVDERALVVALREGEIAAAGLDVYEDEPRVEPGLAELENVVLTPHLGSATVETRTAMAELAARNAIAAVRGEKLLTPVSLPAA